MYHTPILEKTSNCILGVRLDNEKVFFVHQLLGQNILRAFFVVKKHQSFFFEIFI